MFHARQHDMSVGPADWDAKVVMQTLMPPDQAPGRTSGKSHQFKPEGPLWRIPSPPLHRSGNRSYSKLSVNNERR
jgi:hypothetical protein